MRVNVKSTACGRWEGKTFSVAPGELEIRDDLGAELVRSGIAEELKTTQSAVGPQPAAAGSPKGGQEAGKPGGSQEGTK